MSGKCQLVIDWFAVKEIIDQAKNTLKSSLFGYIASKIIDQISAVFDVANDLYNESLTMLDNMTSTIGNLIALVNGDDWIYLVLWEQTNTMKSTLSKEITQINAIIAHLKNIQGRVSDNDKYAKMSRIVALWLISAHRNLVMAVDQSTSDMMVTYFRLSYQKMQGMEDLLSYNKRKKVINSVIGGIQGTLDEMTSTEGRNSIKGEDIMGEVKDLFMAPTEASSELFEVWKFYLTTYNSIFSLYLGRDLGVIIDPIVENLEYLIKNMTGNSAVPAPNSIGKSWIENQKVILKETLAVDMTKDTHIVGAQTKFNGDYSVFRSLLGSLSNKTVEEVEQSVKTRYELQYKISQLIKEDVFDKVLNNDAVLAINKSYIYNGKDENDKNIISDNSGRLGLLFEIRKVLRKYNRVNRREVAGALTSENMVEFHTALVEAKTELNDLDNSTLKSLYVNKGMTILTDEIVSDYIETADAKGVTMLMTMAAKIFTGGSGEIVSDKYIDHFRIRLDILKRYRKILNDIPAYENENINAILGIFESFGMDNLVQNIKGGAMQMCQDMDMGSLIGSSMVAFNALNAIKDCIGQDIPDYRAKEFIEESAGEAIRYIQTTKKRVLDDTLDNILNAFGVNVAWVKSQEMRMEEIKNKGEKVEKLTGYVNDLSS